MKEKNNKIIDQSHLEKNIPVDEEIIKEVKQIYSEEEKDFKILTQKGKVYLNKTLKEKENAYLKFYEKVDQSIENAVEDYLKNDKVFKLILKEYTKKFFKVGLFIGLFLCFPVAYILYRNYNNKFIYNQNINLINEHLQKIEKYSVPWYIKLQKKVKPSLPNSIKEKLYKTGQYLMKFKVIQKIKKDKTLKNV